MRRTPPLPRDRAGPSGAGRRRRVVPVVLAALCASSCEHAVSSPLEGRVEAEALSEVEHLLLARLQDEFGAGARLQRIYGLEPGGRMVLGVATEQPVADSDHAPPVAIAAWEQDAERLSVVARERAFLEARELDDGVALVTEAGELVVRDRTGAETTWAVGVKGDLSPVPGRRDLVVTLRGGAALGADTSVALVGSDGAVRVLADDVGVDDRAAVSPDGTTVVFVSGRTGVASLWRTTLDGAPAVQVTNVGLVGGVGEPPPGFVPPPVTGDRVQWISEDVVRFDAGDGEMWTVDVRTGAAAREGGVP